MKFNKKLQISINNLQSFGQIYFTPKQLYYEFCRTLNSPFRFLTYGNKTITTPISFEKFDEFLKEYLLRNKIENLLEIKPNIKFTRNFPNDLTLYGLPKILICETDEIAQMLRVNQFHLQTPCAVLSLKEATPIPESFQKMLANAENPQVYFLHNANLPTFMLISILRQTIEMKEDITLRPIGLRPIHAMRLHLFANKTEPQNFDFSEFIYLNNAEKKWLLDGHSAEVSAISPVRLMRVLRRIILGLEVPISNWQLKLPKKELGFM